MSNILNLNAKRAARAAARQEPMRVEIGDQVFDLVDEMPIELSDLANNNDISGALKLLLAQPDQDWDRLMACRPSFQDVMDIVEYFGAALGESLRSVEHSTNTGGPSQPTGPTTTNETSPPTYSVAKDVAHQVREVLTS